MSTAIVSQLVDKVTQLPDNLQQKVLDFADTLSHPVLHGVPGSQLLKFAGLIPADDLELMRSAIESECERIDVDQW
jgi:hypothetical protein